MDTKMKYTPIISTALAFLLVGTMAANAADPLAHLAIIQSDKDAIAVARTLLSARDHAFPTTNIKEEINWGNRDEAFWQRCFTATLADGVWDVKSKPEYLKEYGHVEISLGAQDGRFLGSTKGVPLR
jgi:hypothetical protein